MGGDVEGICVRLGCGGNVETGRFDGRLVKTLVGKGGALVGKVVGFWLGTCVPVGFCMSF